MDQASLIAQLRIERPQEEAPRRRVWWWAAAVVAVVAVGGATYAWVPRAVPIRVAVAEPVTAAAAVAPSSILDASGYVVARRQATVSAKITGKVIFVGIEEGQRVERGQVIARLDDTNANASVAQARAELEQSKANLVAAEVAFANAMPTFERSEKQFARAVVSAQTFDTAKASYDAARTGLNVAGRVVEVAEARLALAERNLDDTVVRAPFAGIVTVKAAQEGEMVSPMSAGGGFTRTGIGTIVDMASLEVEVDVSENFINRVVAQQPATVRLNAYPDWSIPARVIAIIPTADRAKATVKVRVGFDAADARILPEMGARVAFLEAAEPGAATTSAAQQPVLVPKESVQADGDTGIVFVVADGGVERRTVRLGAQSASGQIVLAGLVVGTRLARGDLGALVDGSRVTIEQ
ncbi:MAG TPA: efflux RND transporter periplasmic adaptor subunit [Gammaproteobacteria bacterium]|nr:efflux RND transporter periplasmic adaptor subunit [Gammaproteobacteria bacterium]